MILYAFGKVLKRGHGGLIFWFLFRGCRWPKLLLPVKGGNRQSGYGNGELTTPESSLEKKDSSE
jgi:hypothetical protein